jgi:hypothetical protein
MLATAFFEKRATALQCPGDGRRWHRRYNIDLGICCRAVRSKRVLAGRISNISSGGFHFASSEILASGTKVEFSIDWPVLLDGACSLHLKGWGRVRRSDEQGTAIEIERHKLCTRKSQTADPYAMAAGA